MTDRERFEAWWLAGNSRPEDTTTWALEIWQAATAAAEQDKWAAVRRCVEISRHWKYSATYISDTIKAEFPEAWK